MARLDARWFNFAKRGQTWDHFWQDSPATDPTRRAQISWVELETPLGPRRAQVSWVEFETPFGPRTARVSLAWLEVPETATSTGYLGLLILGPARTIFFR